MISFEEARAIVAEAERDKWTHGTYRVKDYGFDLGNAWVIVHGYAEADDDPMYLVMNAPIPVVDKVTGALSCTTHVDPRLDDAADVGPVPESAE